MTTVEPQEPRNAIKTAPAHWEEVARLFSLGGDAAGCWCQWFRLTSPEWRAMKVPQRKDLMRRQFAEEERPPGLLAFVDGQAVGWAAVAPQDCYPRLDHLQLVQRSRKHAPTPEGELWAVTCFVVARTHRRQGVAGTLLDAAVGFAREHGADWVDGYPVDVAARPKATSSGLFHGTVSLFEQGGFEHVYDGVPGRALMRRRA
ncbi:MULTISPECIES: GNAT family N-acetyltransferase [Arthrobacter]|uniref:GNAT family N-acetyltransferase n=2 Tax=Arthrobacter TaxID=1663 RepID=A0ABU9KKT3_9MICC|nr:GNAT family N-acetyltransferase [Arthrobacter sp. YJM1]MDP5226793.1 GNAT family N-acetyltransferase [Arthrobacter sp. YJM1]